MISYRPKYFVLQEFVDPDTYKSLSAKSWIVLDPRILKTADQLREKFGLCTINNWHKGGEWKYRGFRPPNCTVGAPLSQHRFGRALDCSFTTPANLVRGYILEHPDEFPYITTIEDDVTWLHCDCRDNGGIGVQIIRP